MMDSSHLDQAEKSSPEPFSDSSASSDSPDNNGILGDPLVHPRVGEEFQVEIPSILSNYERLVDSSHPFVSGLPIPVMWVRSQTNPFKTERLENLVDPHAIYTNGFVKSENLEVMHSSKMKELVPGQKSQALTDFEADCFLLALYMLGKNLVQVTMFVESKGLGQILAYYYGQFYASERYSRWSECRKMKSKKCVVGHRFFTGYRQQEFFSRLFPRLSEESRAKLLEVSRAFADGSKSLDEYVFTLKAEVGIHALVGAVGIGKKGKEDLTTLIYDSSKNNQNFANRPEVPSGKACSALTRAEIVKYLTGDFRLSKARSNDLFWEAVWPRLLARGWHSEQPKGDGYKGSNQLVFLMPGIQKFSRRKLTKGDHYFDSISDVLAKVANEPKLVELDADGTNPGCSKGENGWSTKIKSDDDDQDSSDNERHCYLKPRVSSGISDLTQFTIVDTGLANEDNPNKVWELRSLAESDLKVNADVLPDVFQRSELSPAPVDVFLPMNHNPMNRRPRTITGQFRRSKDSVPVQKKQRLSSCVDIDVTCVLSLPARNRNSTLKILGPKLSSENVSVSECHTEKSVQDSSSGKHVDLNLPLVSNEPEADDSKVKLEEEVSSSNQNSDVEKKPLSDSEIQTSSDNMATVYPSNNMEPRVDSTSRKPSNTAVESDIIGPQANPDNMECRVNYASWEPPNTVVESDKMEPQLKSYNMELHWDTASREPSDMAIVSDNMNLQMDSGDMEPQMNSGDVNPQMNSGNMEPQVSSASGIPKNNVVKSDQQPRRQSTRNRPLTTKALEALEVGFCSPVRQYRKRSSVGQGQKPKRPRNKSPVFEMRACEEACNGKIDIAGPPPVGSGQ